MYFAKSVISLEYMTVFAMYAWYNFPSETDNVPQTGHTLVGVDSSCTTNPDLQTCPDIKTRYVTSHVDDNLQVIYNIIYFRTDHL